MVKSMKRPLLFLGLMAGTFLVYANVLDNGFVWDDINLILGAPVFRSWENLGKFFTTPFWYLAVGQHVTHHRPMVPVMILIISTFSGVNPLGYHLTSVFLQGILVGLYFFFLKKLGLDKKVVWMAALVFLFHPVHTQVVAWACSTNIIVQGLCFVAVLWMSVKIPETRAGTKKTVLFCGIFFFYLIGLMSYEVTIVLPVLIFLNDLLLPFNKQWKKSARDRWIEYSGYTLVTLAFAALALYSVKASGSSFHIDYNPAVTNVVYTQAPFEKLLLPLNVLSRYTELLVFPLVVVPDAYFKSTEFSVSAVASVLLIVFLSFAVFRASKNKRLMVIALAWIYLPLLPVSQLISTGGQFSNRLLFIPSMGYALWAGLVAHWLLTRKPAVEQPKKKRAVLFACAAFLLFLFGKTLHQNQIWQDDFIFWLEASIHAPDKPSTRNSLGTALAIRRHYKEAKKEFEAALKLAPDFQLAAQNYAQVLKDLGETEEAKIYEAKAGKSI